MLPASGTVLVKKTDGDDWFEEILDSADIPVYAASGTNFQEANISGSNIEEVLSKTADALNLKASSSQLTTTSGDLQSQIDDLEGNLTQVVEVPVTSGQNLLIASNLLFNSGSEFQIGSNYTVGGNSITIDEVGTYRVSWLVNVRQGGTTASNRQRNLEVELRLDSTAIPDTRTSCPTDPSSGQFFASLYGEHILDMTTASGVVDLAFQDRSTKSTAAVVLVIHNGLFKVERIQ